MLAVSANALLGAVWPEGCRKPDELNHTLRAKDHVGPTPCCRQTLVPLALTKALSLDQRMSDEIARSNAGLVGRGA
jgi:hypothetical protein